MHPNWDYHIFFILLLFDNQFFNFSDCFVKINYVIFIIKRYLRKKPFMITPCNHVFHSECLEKWLELKSECPYCKQQLPQLE